jgi:Secretion system C-terminal sorting domain
MKKLIHLSILQLFFLTNLSAQQTNDLRGVRYYYSTPTLGDLSSSLVGFKPLTIEEKNDFYYLSGKATFSNYLIKINKFSNTPVWDYRDSVFSPVVGITFTSDENILMATSVICVSNSNCIDDSIKITKLNPNGEFEINKFPVDSDTSTIISAFDRIRPDVNIASGWKDYPSSVGTPVSAFPLAFPFLININDNGLIVDSALLPITNTYQNLIVMNGIAERTFPYNNDYLTFGSFQRQYSTNQLNRYTLCPVLWHWNSDTIYTTREILANYPNHNSEESDEQMLNCDGSQNSFAFTFVKSTDGTNPDPYPVYVAYIDSTLNVIWDKKIGNLPPEYGYDIHNVKISPISGEVFVIGQCINMDTYAATQFVAKYRKNGPLLYIKYFTIDESSDNKIFTLSILEDGDLIFAGRSYKDGITSFFTYRTGPDGYHEDGAYLGLEEVLASETEIGIFPNPSDGIFQVSSVSTEPMRITMLDQQGKQVAQFELNELSSDNSFDLSDQAPGVYFGHISQGEQQWVKKLVVR